MPTLEDAPPEGARTSGSAGSSTVWGWAAGIGLVGGCLVGAVLLPLWALDESVGGGGGAPVVLFGALFGLVVGATIGFLIGLSTAAVIIVLSRRPRVGPALGAVTATEGRDGTGLHPQDS